MKEISDYLIKYLKEIEPYSKKKYTPTKNMQKIILHILHSLHEATGTYNKNNIIETDITNTYGNKDFPKGESFSYATPDIHDKIKSSQKYVMKYEFKLNKQNVIIHLIYCLDKEKDKKLIENISMEHVRKMFEYYIYKIYLWLFIANKQKPAICSENLHIYIYMTNLIKLIANKGEMLNRKHSNSAFTTSCQKNIEIHLYREEDWFKTLIHETFHCFGFDFSGIENLKSHSQKQILQTFTVKSDVNLFEVYCELWAEFINIIIYVFLKKGSGQFNFNKCWELIFYEQQFSIYQCAKVLSHYNIKYDDLKYNTNNLSAKFNEGTNIFAYYILKSMYIYYINDFIDFTILHNKRTPFLFNNSIATIDAFLNIILKHYGENGEYDLLFEGKITKMVYYIHKHKSNRIEKITMKMNLLEG